MRIPRIHHPERLIVGSQIALSDDAANHVGRVLRMTAGQHLQLFDGSNQVFDAVITEAGKKNVTVEVLSGEPDDRESPLHIHLGQVMSRGEKMEFTIQKSIELGVSLITPLFSERCGVKLDAERLQKKIQQWQKIVLVTSAFHMPRSVLDFADKGLDIVPFPCDYQLSGKMQLSIFSFMPQGFALELSAMALKEYLGLLALKIL
jgi:hypothetical protein